MNAHRCVRCNAAWAGDTGHENRFVYITRFCPTCIEKFPAIPEGVLRRRDMSPRIKHVVAEGA